MANFNDAIVKTLAKEGGAKFTDIAGDRGGATNTAFRKQHTRMWISAISPNSKRAIFTNVTIGTAFAATISLHSSSPKIYLILR